MLFTLIICAFLYADTYRLSSKKGVEVVIDKKYIDQPGRYRTRQNYIVQTNLRELMVSKGVMNSIHVGDTVEVQFSSLTHSAQKIFYADVDYNYVAGVGFLRGRIGRILTPLTVFVGILVMIFYKDEKNPSARKRWTFFLFIGSLCLLFFHLGL